MKRKFVVLLAALILVVGIMPAAAQEDPAQVHKEALRAAIDGFNAGNLQAFTSLYAEQYVMNQGGTTQEPISREDVAMYAGALLGAMPDLRITPSVIIAQGDQVATELVFSGTFSQPFVFPPISTDPFPPNSQPVTWTEMDFLHFNADGLIDAEWALGDPTVMFSQLGFIPAQEGEVTGTPLDEPAGYQTLSADELAATFTSGMGERNQQQFQDELALGVGASDASMQYYTDPYISWNNSAPYSVTAQDAQGDAAFLENLKQVMPDVAIKPVELIVSEGDWVAGVIMLSGTFTQDADFFGMPLTHTDQKIEWMFGGINRYNADGKIVEQWIEGDPSPLLQGLGLIPSSDG